MAKKSAKNTEWLIEAAQELGVSSALASSLEVLGNRLIQDMYGDDIARLNITTVLQLIEALPMLEKRPKVSSTHQSTIHSFIWRQARALHHKAWRARIVGVDLPAPGCERMALELWAIHNGVSDVLDAYSCYLNSPWGYDSTHAVIQRAWRSSTPTTWRVGDAYCGGRLATQLSGMSQNAAHELGRRLRQIATHRLIGAKSTAATRERAASAKLPGNVSKVTDFLQERIDTSVSQGVGLEMLRVHGRSRTALASDFHAMLHLCAQSSLCLTASGQQKTVLNLDLEELTLTCECDESCQRLCSSKASAAHDMLTGLLELKKETLQELDGALAVPLWGRSLNNLLDGLDVEINPVVPAEWSGSPTEFGWRVEGNDEDGFSFYPAVVRDKKSGQGVITKRLKLSEDDVSDLLEELDNPRDQAMLQSWHYLEQMGLFKRHYNHYSRSYFATHPRVLAAMEQLAGLEHVYYFSGKSVPLRIQVMPGVLGFETRGDEGQVAATLSFGEQTLESYETLELLDELGESTRIVNSFDFGDAMAHLILWTMTKRVFAAAQRAQQVFEKTLPAQAREVVLNRAAAITAHTPLSLSQELRGERVEARTHQIITLKMHHGVLDLTLRASPLAGAPSCEPGEGAPLLYATRDTRPVYVERDWDRETMHARELADMLGIAQEDHANYRWGLSGEAALEALAVLKDLREEQGFEVVWDTRRVTIAPPMESGALAVNVTSIDRYFKMGGSVSVQGEQVPLEQLLRAAREQRDWVQLSEDHWAKMTQGLKQSIQRIGALLDEEGKDLEISPLSAPALMALARDQQLTVTGPAKWLEMSDAIRAAEHAEIATPDGFVGELRDYQREGFVWMARLAMWSPGACLADDMGLGKTVQAIALLLHRVEQGPVILVGPTTLGFNWQREVARFAPSLTFHLIRSSAELDALPATLSGGECVYMSYDLAARNEAWCAKQTWGTRVLDEAQAIKNASTQRARAMHELEADFSLILTGTPVENHTGELWSLMEVVAPGLLGGQSAFRKRFQLPIEQRDDAVARMTLATLVSPFVLRRLKSQVARDLPERTDIRLDVELSREERKMYDTLRASAMEAMQETRDDEIQEGKKRFELLAAITRLRQLACHPKLYNAKTTCESSKVRELVEKLSEVREEGHHALVFSQFTSLLDLVEQDLVARGFRVAKLTGATATSKRATLVEDYQRGEYDVFLLSIKAGGVGLNLTRASFVFLLDPWWNPAVEDQATDRVHRIGQTQPVTVYRLVSMETIEEVIYQMHTSKRALLDAVMAGSGSSKALSVEELRAMIEGDVSTLPVAEQYTEAAAVPTQPKHSAASKMLAAPSSPLARQEEEVPASAVTSGEVSALDTTEMWARVEAYFEHKLSEGSLTEGSVKVYSPKVRKLLAYVAHLGELPEELAQDYREAIDSGRIKRSATHYKMASNSAAHLLEALK